MDNRNKDTESGLRFVNPPGLYNPAPNGYSHLALFPKGWRIILPAGHRRPNIRRGEVHSLRRGAR
jgi:hypothetical protein